MELNAVRRSLLAFFGLLLVCLLGCASTPYSGAGKDKSDALLRAQLAQAQQAPPSPAGRIIFAGFAMHSQSKAFRGDVLSTEVWVRKIDPSAVVFKLNNPVVGQDADWPFATAENVTAVLKKVAELARPQDKVVVLFSTHGGVDALSINFADKHYPHLSARWLNERLGGLRGHPTLLLLSACYSGSFVAPMRSPSRIILTAAAADRSSFGCDFGSSNTFFIDALLNQDQGKEKSLVQLMGAAQVDIDKRERDLDLKPPSLPQSAYGPLVRAWAAQPLSAWFEPPRQATTDRPLR
jgi:Peptidase C13 family